MDCMRINCAHDHAATPGRRMIETPAPAARRASGRRCRVLMDLARAEVAHRAGRARTSRRSSSWRPRAIAFGRVTRAGADLAAPADGRVRQPEPARPTVRSPSNAALARRARPGGRAPTSPDARAHGCGPSRVTGDRRTGVPLRRGGRRPPTSTPETVLQLHRHGRVNSHGRRVPRRRLLRARSGYLAAAPRATCSRLTRSLASRARPPVTDQEGRVHRARRRSAVRCRRCSPT